MGCISYLASPLSGGSIKSWVNRTAREGVQVRASRHVRFKGARHRHWQKPAEKNLLGTCAEPLTFSSRFQPLEGLMHLPLSCCEKAETEKSLCGLSVGGGAAASLEDVQ